MADSTVSDVIDLAAVALGDPEKQLFDNTKLLPHFKTAYRDLYRVMMARNFQKVKREVYYNLPAYTSRLSPAVAGISDMGEPTKLWERGGLTTTTVSTLTNATPVVVTVASATGFTTNDDLMIYGVVVTSGTGKPVNGHWYATIDGSAFTLLGSEAAGTYSSGGTVTRSDEKFDEMNSADTLPEGNEGSGIVYWKWRDDTFWFRPATAVRQLKIEYESSGAAPTSGSIGIDDALDFLGHQTAAHAAQSLGMKDRYVALLRKAVGPSGETDGSGGLLRDLLIPMSKEKHKRIYQPGRFRAMRY